MRGRLLLIAILLTGIACGPKTGARLQPIAAQTATVGVELDIMLRASTSAHVDFKYSSDLDLQKRTLKPTLTPFQNGEALFRWTPLGSDLGKHQIRFSAVVDGTTATETVDVSVIAGADPIQFREPVGDGTTLDPARAPCSDVSVLVDDTSATAVTLAPGSVWPSGAMLNVDGPLSGTIRFCPTAAQIQATTIFPLSIVASDGGGAKAEKRYTIVIGTLPPKLPPPPPPPPPATDMGAADMGAVDMAPVMTCVTTPPAIATTPHANITTTGNPHIYAQLSSPAQISFAGVYWSTTAPADPNNPDLSAMNEVDMLLLSGDYGNGQWGATIPSPVAGSAAGTSSDIYYVIGVLDGADSVANCSANVAFAPATGTYDFVITEAQ